MKPTLRIVLAYLAVTLVLSCVSLTYEWPQPIVEPEGTWAYYGEVGLRDGLLVYGGHFPPGPDSQAALHAPAFMPFPVFAGAGPEGGGIYVAVWLPLLLAAAFHIRWRNHRDKRSRALSSPASS